MRRRLVVGFLAVLTCVGVLTSALGYWVHQVLLDTDTWVATVGPLADDEQITSAVGDRLTTEVFELLDVEDRVADALPSEAAVLAAPLASSLEGFVGDGVDDVLASDRFAEFWRNANRVVHTEAVAFVRGDTEVIRANDGVVTLDLTPLIARALEEIQSLAPEFVTSRVDLSQISTSTAKAEAIAAIEEFTGKDLPADFGEIVLFQSDELAAVQDAVAWFDRLVIVLPILTVALAAATIALAVDRRRLLMQLGAGIVLTMAVVLALAGAVRSTVLEAIGNAEARDATATTLAAIFGDLRTMTWVIGIAGGLIVVVAWATSDQRWAVALRDRLGAAGSRAASGAQAGAARATAERDAGFPQVTAHQTGLRWGGAVVAALALVLLTVSWPLLLAVAVALGAWEVAITVLAGEPDEAQAT